MRAQAARATPETAGESPRSRSEAGVAMTGKISATLRESLFAPVRDRYGAHADAVRYLYLCDCTFSTRATEDQPPARRSPADHTADRSPHRRDSLSRGRDGEGG